MTSWRVSEFTLSIAHRCLGGSYISSPMIRRRRDFQRIPPGLRSASGGFWKRRRIQRRAGSALDPGMGGYTGGRTTRSRMLFAEYCFPSLAVLPPDFRQFRVSPFLARDLRKLARPTMVVCGRVVPVVCSASEIVACRPQYFSYSASTTRIRRSGWPGLLCHGLTCSMARFVR